MKLGRISSIRLKGYCWRQRIGIGLVRGKLDGKDAESASSVIRDFDSCEDLEREWILADKKLL